MIILLFACVFVLLLLGFPVAFCLGGVAVLFGLFHEGVNLALLPARTFGIMDNEVLVAVPLFVYMGVMLERSGIAESMLETMALIFGRVRGGLAISVVLVGGLLAASTGIVGATVVTMGLLSLPTMLKRGYSKELTTGTIAASGTLGQIIPPSIVLILLGNVLNVPVGHMFKAAMLPGLILVGLYLLWIAGVAFFRPGSAPAMPASEIAAFQGGGRLIARVIKAFLPPVVLMVAVLGSIFAGIASPTEASAVGALGATILTALHRKLSLKTLRHVMRETTSLTSMVFIILVGAAAFSLVFRDLGGEDYMRDLLPDPNESHGRYLLVIMLVIFVAGFFIDFIEIIYIVIPVILAAPPTEVNLLWLGILIAMNQQTSFLTPPFGFALFYLKGVAPPEIKTLHIYRGIVPFIAIQIIALILVLLFPDLVLWAIPTD